MAASRLHQTIVERLRAVPALGLALLRAARIDVPDDVVATGISASFSPVVDDLHVDGATEIRSRDGTLQRIVLIDVQLTRIEDKLFTLPVYQALARRRHRVPCDVVVVAMADRVARALRAPITLGGGSVFRAIVIGRDELEAIDPSATPARAEIAFLRALVLGRTRPQEVLDADAAFEDLPDEVAMVYLELIIRTLPHEVRTAVEKLMDKQGHTPKRRLGGIFTERGRREGLERGLEQGLERGLEQGLAIARAVLRNVLVARGIELGEADEALLSGCRDEAALTRWAARAATATSASEIFEQAP